jgi:hypothetical protein
MKRYLTPLVAVFLAVQASVNAVEPCTDDITDIKCPLEGCGPTSGPRPVDGKLKEQKNIRTAPDGPGKVMTIEELKEKPNPSRRRFRSDNRERGVLREMGEGDKS